MDSTGTTSTANQPKITEITTEDGYENQQKIEKLLVNFRTGSTDTKQLISLQLLPQYLTSSNLKQVFPSLNFSFIFRLINTSPETKDKELLVSIGVLCLLPFYHNLELVDTDMLLNLVDVIILKLDCTNETNCKYTGLVLKAWLEASNCLNFSKRVLKVEEGKESDSNFNKFIKFLIDVQNQIDTIEDSAPEEKVNSLKEIVKDGYLILNFSFNKVCKDFKLINGLIRNQAILLKIISLTTELNTLINLLDIYNDLFKHIEFHKDNDNIENQIGIITKSTFNKLLENLYTKLTVKLNLQLKRKILLLVGILTKQFYFYWCDSTIQLNQQFIELILRLVCLELRLNLSSFDTQTKVKTDYHQTKPKGKDELEAEIGKIEENQNSEIFQIEFLILVEFLDTFTTHLSDESVVIGLDNLHQVLTWIRETYADILQFLNEPVIAADPEFQLCLTNSLLNYLAQDPSIIESGNKMELLNLVLSIDAYQISHKETLDKLNLNFNLIKVFLMFDTNPNIEAILVENLNTILPIILEVFNKNKKEELVVAVHLLHLLNTWFDVNLESSVQKKVDLLFDKYKALDLI